MTKRLKAHLIILLLLTIFSFLLSYPLIAQKEAKKKNVPQGTPVLWRDPVDVSARNLKYGPGSEDSAPLPPFTFTEEDKGGTSPKFYVTDARGVTWKVKLGVEAQAETVAVRLLWAVGYFAEEAYYFDSVEVKKLPKLSRGREFVKDKSIVFGARFEPRRENVTRGHAWDWEDNPFAGTRELDGLKVIMVMLNNYDTRVDNNGILFVKNPETNEVEVQYTVTDIGATFGSVGGLGGKRSKNNLQDFQSSKFIIGVENGMVKFDYHTRPRGMGVFAAIFNPFYYKRQAKKERVMSNIPVENARRMGSLFSKLTDEQLRNAFRAANYDEATMEGFIKVLRARINQLAQL